MDAPLKFDQIFRRVVAHLLTPLVRVLIRNGMSFNAFSDVAKQVYVEVGMRELAIPGRKQTISRISILTGLSRKEVQRLLGAQGETENSAAQERYNRAARVIAGWIRDREFTDPAGDPLVLAQGGDGANFSMLVKRYSGDVPARAVLDELLRVGAVERLADDRVRLLARAYVPRTSDLDKLDILGTDVADLITTIDHNMEYGAEDPRFQRKVMYDNLPQESIPEFRGVSAKLGQTLLEVVDEWLSQHDRDVNSSVNGTGRMRAGIGIYYFEENLKAGPGGE